MIETRWWNPKYLKKTIFDFIRTKQNSVYSVHGTAGLKLLTRITLSSSHLNEHKFQHSLRNTVKQYIFYKPIFKNKIGTSKTSTR